MNITKLFSLSVILAILIVPITSCSAVYAEEGFIKGKITESDGKMPIAGVRIAATQVVKEGEDYELGFAETNNKGEYVIENLSAGIYDVTASFPGFADATKSNIAVASSKVTSNIDFILLKYGSISGHVTKNDGVTPLSNVSIGAYGISSGIAFCTSGVDGSFKLEELLAGAYDLEAEVGGYAFSPIEGITLEEGADVKDIVIKAHKKYLGQISGTVTESDGVTPISGASISVIPQDAESTDNILGQKAISEEDGSYAIEALQGGTYILQAIKSGFRLDIRTVTVSEDIPVTVDISLLTTYGSISGYVFKEDGISPVVGATIYCVNIAFPTTPIEIKSVTDAQGKFVLNGLRSGNYSVQAKIEGYPIQFKSSIDVVVNQETQGINFMLNISTGAISGIILDKDSAQTIPGSFVLTGPSDGSGGTGAYKITSDGTFLIEKLQPGTYKAIAGAIDYLNSTEENIIVTEGETTNITFYLDRE